MRSSEVASAEKRNFNKRISDSSGVAQEPQALRQGSFAEIFQGGLPGKINRQKGSEIASSVADEAAGGGRFGDSGLLASQQTGRRNADCRDGRIGFVRRWLGVSVPAWRSRLSADTPRRWSRRSPPRCRCCRR